MTNSVDKFIRDVMMNVKANHPVSIVYSDDPNDTLELLKSAIPVIREKTDKIYYWTARERWIDISAKDKTLAELIASPNKVNLSQDQSKSPLSFCFSSPEQLKARNPIFVVSLLSSQFKNENIGMLQELRDFDYIARNGVNDSYRIVILANKSFTIPADYENIFGVVNHEVPSLEELGKVYDTDFMKEYIEKILLSLYGGKPENLLKEFKNLKDYTVNTLNGLTARQFKLILYKAVSHSVVKDSNGQVVTSVDFEKYKEFIYNKKFEEISRTGILTLLKPTPMSQVGGFQPLKQWLEERRWAFSSEAEKAGVDTPKGMALIGPPGTGKTWIAKATADTLQFPCLQFNVDAVFNKWVGDSEKNMESALQTIEAMAPCVLFVDEIDKVFSSMAGGGSGTDSGVTARVFGKLLSWMQDNKSKIFVIVTANRIQNIPSEFLRKGRLDEIWCVNFPTASERNEIFNIHLAKRGHKLNDLSALLNVTDEYSSSEIEYIVKEATTQAAFQKKKLSVDHLVTEAKRVTPTAVAFKDDIERMKTWAMTHARMASIAEVSSVDTVSREI